MADVDPTKELGQDGVNLDNIDNDIAEINENDPDQLVCPGILTTDREEITNFLNKILQPTTQKDPVFAHNLSEEDLENLAKLSQQHAPTWIDLWDDPRKLFSDTAHEFFTDPSCSKRLYWTFRHEQIQQITGTVDKELGALQTLGIKLKEAIQQQLDSDPNNSENIELKRIFNSGDPTEIYSDFIHRSDILSKLFDEEKISRLQEQITETFNDLIKKLKLDKELYPTMPDLINYFLKIRAMYQGVAITKLITNPPDPLNESFEIKQGNTILVNISYEPKLTSTEQKSKTLKFTIAPNLASEDLQKALLIMNDQSARHQELSYKNKIEIWGFKNKPERALQLYELTIQSGRVPTIEPATLKAWQDNPKLQKNPNLQRILALHQQLNPNSKKGLKDRFHEMRTEILTKQRLSRQKKLSQQQSDNRPQEPTIPTTSTNTAPSINTENQSTPTSPQSPRGR